ncbi:MAG: hypothetical protein RLZ54_618 [Candidatus Parcubacteria bacterium]|jgi:hypothetical protein
MSIEKKESYIDPMKKIEDRLHNLEIMMPDPLYEFLKKMKNPEEVKKYTWTARIENGELHFSMKYTDGLVYDIAINSFPEDQKDGVGVLDVKRSSDRNHHYKHTFNSSQTPYENFFDRTRAKIAQGELDSFILPPDEVIVFANILQVYCLDNIKE